VEGIHDSLRGNEVSVVARITDERPPEAIRLAEVVRHVGRPEEALFPPTRAQLPEAGFPSLTITEVKGSGRQKAITEHYRGSELAVHLRPKLKLECVVESKDVGVIKEVILRHARTGSVGDGKLFVLPVEEAVRIRTGEEGELVLQAHEAEEVSVNGDRA
jgi:nitrogen regulatory protein P-II 1